MLRDDEVERVAQQVHERFLAATPLADDHPARRPWAELSDDLRAMNREQVRENVRRLEAMGYRLVPLAELGPTAEPLGALPDDQVEQLARDEHLRWCDTKRSQGYRLGPVRVDDGPDRRHPDLVPWEQLDEPAREKDRRPMRTMVAAFVAAGWAVLPEGG